ncbi:non-specific lipid transfer protein GPI-anchored 25-like [Populus nigra]|uniref:non-specific lipid transfer protein GPI-anchored 25-like n=1 Tax=Populus nigra TaxID=3691 RepID=UPI002B27394F|nr:non-specific lipid transfer protein GPI-anchored 25-like [Populus nigra]
MSWWPSLPVSAPPDRVTDTATSQCCDTLSKAFNSGDGNCFCYLIMQPLIFGFPLNESRVIALPSVCSLSSLVSLDLLCSGSPALPPFTAQQLQILQVLMIFH